MAFSDCSFFQFLSFRFTFADKVGQSSFRELDLQSLFSERLWLRLHSVSFLQLERSRKSGVSRSVEVKQHLSRLARYRKRTATRKESRDRRALFLQTAKKLLFCPLRSSSLSPGCLSVP